MESNQFPSTITLHDGPAVTVRLMTVADSAAMLAFFQGLPEEDRMFLRNDVTKPEVVDRFVRDVDHELVIGLVAEVSGALTKRSLSRCDGLRFDSSKESSDVSSRANSG